MIKLLKTILRTILTFEPIRYLIDIIYVRFFSDQDFKDYIQHNYKNVPAKSYNNDNIILCDIFYVPESLICYSLFLKELSEIHQANIATYIEGNNRILPKVSSAYRSFNCNRLIRVKLNREQEKQVKELTQKTLKDVKSKKELIDYKVKGIRIGLDIYETYLREYSKETIDFNDPLYQLAIKRAFEFYLFWDEFLSKGNVKSFVVSHDIYLNMGLICRLAYKYDIPVYLPNCRRLTLAKQDFDSGSHFNEFPKLFKSTLTQSEQEEALKLAEVKLNERLKGSNDDLAFASTSAFSVTNSESLKKVFKSTKRPRVLIATHCFFDNPHAYSEMLFPDFYEWLDFLGKISMETDYDWYLKLHPDPLEETFKVVNMFVEKYPAFNLLSLDVTHTDILNEGVDYVLTCYGTIGEEYAFYNIPVINSSYNPRSAYPINIHAKSIDDYRNILLDIEKVKIDVDKSLLFESYYMNRNYIWVDDLVFDSFRDFINGHKQEKRLSNKVFRYYLNHYRPEKARETQDKMREFILSGKKNYFAKGPI